MVTHRIVAYLISLAVGYWVFTLAEKEKGFAKTLGKVVAWTILVVSLLGPLCLAGQAIVCHSGNASCSYAGNCPIGGWGGHGFGRRGMMGMNCPEMSGDNKEEGSMMMKHHGMMGGMKDKDEVGSKDKAK